MGYIECILSKYKYPLHLWATYNLSHSIRFICAASSNVTGTQTVRFILLKLEIDHCPRSYYLYHNKALTLEK